MFRTTAFLLAIIAALVITGDGEASITPDSQGEICEAALGEMIASDGGNSQPHRLGRVHPALMHGAGGRPDEWMLEYGRRVALFESSISQASRDCPHFAPYTGQLPGHLLVSSRPSPSLYTPR